MPWPGSFSANLTTLRGTGATNPGWRGTQYISLSSNVVVFAARVNQALFDDTFASVDYEAVTTGAYTDIEDGMTVILSQSNDPALGYFVGRARLNGAGDVATATTLYINETSADVTDNDYIFVLNDWRIAQRLHRWDTDSDTLYVDYDVPFADPAPIINGLQSAYAGFASGSPEGLSLDLTAVGLAVADGATIDAGTWQWTMPTGFTLTGGSLTTAHVIGRFDPAADEYWCSVYVEDSNGTGTTFRFAVWSHNTTYPPALGFSGASWNANIEGGWNASISAFEGVEDVLDGTLCVLWTVGYYNGSQAVILSNVDLVGRFRSEATGSDGDETYSTLPRDTEFQIEGVGAQLARISGQSVEMRQWTLPSVWGEIDQFTPWRAVVHLLQTQCTLLTVSALTFDDTTDDYLYYGDTTQGESLFEMLNYIAEHINAALEFAPQGELRMVRAAPYLNDADRNALITAANWTEQDMFGYGHDREYNESVGQVIATGGAYEESSGQVFVVKSVAPGQARSTGPGSSSLDSQVLDASLTPAEAQSILSQRAGHHFAWLNREDELPIVLPDGYHFLIPSMAVWHTWNISAASNSRGIVYGTNTRWLLTEISLSHDNETGMRSVDGMFVRETRGNPGKALPLPTGEESPTPALPVTPPFPTFPGLPEAPGILYPGDDPDVLPPAIPEPEIAVSDGNIVAAWVDDMLAVCTNYKTTTSPNWMVITPALGVGESIVAFVWNRFDQGAYLLISDGAASRVLRTSNALAASPTWQSGASVEGDYDSIRTTATAGEVYIYAATGSGGSTFDTTFDFTIGLNSWVVQSSLGTSTGSGVAHTDAQPSACWYRGVRIRYDWGASVTITDIEAIWDVTPSSGACNPPAVASQFVQDSGSIVDALGFSMASPTFTHTWSGSLITDHLRVFGHSSARGTQPQLGGSVTLKSVRVQGIQSGGGSGGAFVAYSSDGGVTWGTPASVGGNPGIGGFDAIKIGTQSLAGRAGQVELSTTAGGGYSDYGAALTGVADPACIVIPRYIFGSTSSGNISTSTPEFLCVSDLLDASNESVWKVTASGATYTDITPNNGGNEGLAVSSECVTMAWLSGSVIAAILDFAGTRRLYTSANAGSAWSDRAALSVEARYIRMRRNDTTLSELFYVDDRPYFSDDFGVTQTERTFPSADAVQGIEVY